MLFLIAIYNRITDRLAHIADKVCGYSSVGNLIAPPDHSGSSSNVCTALALVSAFVRRNPCMLFADSENKIASPLPDGFPRKSPSDRLLCRPKR